MIALVFAVGVLTGWLLSLASKALPRLSPNFSAPVSDAQPNRWFVLHRGSELLTGTAYALLWVRFGSTLTLLFLALSFALLLLIAIIDIKYRLVLNSVVYPAVVVVVILQGLFFPQDALTIALGGCMTFGIFALTAWLRPGQIGGGDIKLATLIGLTFGFPQVLWALLVGAGVGGAAAAYLILMRRQSAAATIPYAPFLCFGAMTNRQYAFSG